MLALLFLLPQIVYTSPTSPPLHSPYHSTLYPFPSSRHLLLGTLLSLPAPSHQFQLSDLQLPSLPPPPPWLPTISLSSIAGGFKQLGSSLRSLPDLQLPWKDLLAELVKAAANDPNDGSSEEQLEKENRQLNQMLNKPLEDIENLVDTR